MAQEQVVNMTKVYQCLCGQCLFSGLMEGFKCETWVGLERWKDMCIYAATKKEPSPKGDDRDAPSPLFPHIYLHTLHGLTGKQLLPTVECQTPEFTSMVVEWYIENYDAFRPKHDEGEEIAQCRFHITLAQPEQTIPAAANRLILPTLLIELLGKLGLPPIGSDVQPEPIHLQVNLLWLQTMEGCEVCGERAAEEYIPFYNCRFCGARPVKHHGKCCPKRREDNRVHGDLRDEYSLQLLLQSIMDPERYDQLERKYSRDFLASLSHGPLPFRAPPGYQ